MWRGLNFSYSSLTFLNSSSTNFFSASNSSNFFWGKKQRKYENNCYRLIKLRSNFNCNKKVLLRERKRHTDRSVSSTPSVSLGGVPPPPSQVWWGGGGTQGGVPPGSGTPPPARSDRGGGGYPSWTWPGYPPPPPPTHTDVNRLKNFYGKSH